MRKYWWVWLVSGLALLPPGLFVVLIALRELGSPTLVTPERAAIVGVWTNADGARLEFAANGTFKTSKMPVLDDPLTHDNDLPGNGTGTWQIESSDAANGGGVYLQIGGGVLLNAAGDPGHPRLLVFIGDPDEDNEFIFTKKS